MGWRWQLDPSQAGYYNDQEYGQVWRDGQMNWVWVDGVQSEPRFAGVDDGGNPMYVSPPPDPSGQIVKRDYWEYGGEGAPNLRSQYVDSGSGLPIANQGDYEWRQLLTEITNRAQSAGPDPWAQVAAVSAMGTKALAIASEMGLFPPDVTAILGPQLAARQAEESDLNHFGLTGVFENPGRFVTTPLKGIEQTIRNIDDRPFDPAGVLDSFRGDSETQPIDRIALGPIADTGVRDLGRMYGRAAAVVGAAAALGGGTAGAETGGAETVGAYGGFDNAAVAGADYGAGSAGAGLSYSPSEVGMEGSWGINPSEVGFEGGSGLSTGGGGLGGGGGGITGGGAVGDVAGGVAGGSALSRLMEGSGTAADWLDLAGRLAPSVLGAYAANQQSKDLAALGDKYFNVGAPSRARFEASFAPGFTMENDPGYRDALDQTTKSFLHKASIGGNPAESPNAWMQTLKDVNSTFAYPALSEYRRMNAGAGGLASLTAAAPQLETGAVNAQRGVYDAIGAGAADIFSPPKSLADLLREYRRYA